MRRRWSCRRSSWRRPNTLLRRLTANMRRQVSQLFTVDLVLHAFTSMSQLPSVAVCCRMNIVAAELQSIMDLILSGCAAMCRTSVRLNFAFCDLRWPVSWWSLRVTWNVQRSALRCLRGNHFLPPPPTSSKVTTMLLLIFSHFSFYLLLLRPHLKWIASALSWMRSWKPCRTTWSLWRLRQRR